MKKKHWLIIELIAVVLAIMVLAAVMLPKFIASQNINTPKHFPDGNFRKIMEEYLPVEPGGHYTREDAKTKSMAFGTFYVGRKDIHTLKGIEHFVGVKDLFCENNQLKVLDVSALTKLKTLEASNNQLTIIKLPITDTLHDLMLWKNGLTEIDVSHNTNLQQFGLTDNQIKMIDVSKNVNLERFYIANNQIQTLDITQNTKLIYLSVRNNPITTIALPESAPLEYIDLAYTQINRVPDLSLYSSIKTVDLRGLHLNPNDLELVYALEDRIGKEVIMIGGYVQSGIVYDGKDLEKWAKILDKTIIK